MKIAIATMDGEQISSHFGRSTYFAIYQTDGKNIMDKSLRENTYTHHFKRGGNHDGHEPGHHHGQGHHGHGGVYEGLKDCQVVICRGMGQRAWEDLSTQGMEVITTEEIYCNEAVKKYLDGNLEHISGRLHIK